MAFALGGDRLARLSGSRSAPVHIVVPHARPLVRCPATFGRNPTPPDAPKDGRKGGREWLETILSRFGPTTDRAQNIMTLDFEKPLLELDKRIKEVG